MPSKHSRRQRNFLSPGTSKKTKCLIADIAMPAMSGPDLQSELKRRRHRMPIIFITAHETHALRGRLVDEGAVACLSKPFSDHALLTALNAALGVN
jgi:FixJ family two-component response regulator